MVDKVIENNRVSIIGEIVSDFRFSHEVFGEGFYIIDVSVNRLSDMTDIIPLMVSERLVDVKQSYIGQLVEATGPSTARTAGRSHLAGAVCGVWPLSCFPFVFRKPPYFGAGHPSRALSCPQRKKSHTAPYRRSRGAFSVLPHCSHESEHSSLPPLVFCSTH